MTRRTDLYEVHRALGASFTEFAGWEMPVRYESETAEHNAVRTTAGLFDLSHMGEIEITGPGAAAALDFALVGRPSRIGQGKARYTMICDEDGGILDDLVVYRLTDEEFLVVANAGNVDTVADELERRSHGFDVAVENASDHWCLIAVQGPNAYAIMAECSSVDTGDLKYYSIVEATVSGHDVLVARTGYTGEDGFEVYCTPNDAVAVWNSMAACGHRYHLRPAGLACRDTLRLEAGMPLYGHELDKTTSPFDAGLGRIVAFDKDGGFVGEMALAVKADNPSTHVLVGLSTSGRRAPRHGYAVSDRSSGRSVGWVTSGAPSPTLGHPIAMAYVEREYAGIGEKVVVDIRGSSEDALIVPMPFYKRGAKRGASNRTKE
ncbi:glycine cleavage system aminomethyltransferase GcvT [Nocardioides taihuensis]|uniref:Aminomethyltransferase n=1 Tax=Nocardioides taihuensis TaxID=1835606 RepID=A0ABW0BF61_9ACTN